jgi:transcriptional regulator with XRE-family HTH domain
MEFYQELRRIRKENGMSQEDFAERLGVSRQAVGKWESGQGFPETEKLLQISGLFNVSLDSLLKGERHDSKRDDEPGFYANREIVESFLLSKRQKATRIGVGVGVIILSLVFVFIFEDNRGTILFLLGTAIGVGVLVSQVFQPKRYGELESQPLLFDSAFIKGFRGAYETRRKRYGLLIALGVVLVIVSFAAAALFDGFSDPSGQRAMAALPPLWAIAVFLFINAGSALSAEGVIANNADHVKAMKWENDQLLTEKEKARENDRRNGWIWGSVMPLSVMAFLAIGFIWKAWHPGWLVLPVAAMICVGISGWRNSRSQFKK